MDYFTIKNIFNKGRLIISISLGFLNSITCLINAGNAINNIPLKFYKLFSSKSEEESSWSSSSSRTSTPPSSILSFLFTSTPYSSPWMYSTNGDLIGSESGVFMASFEELQLEQERKKLHKSNAKKPSPCRRNKNVKKEYPPPIPSWRGKLPGDVQPWSLSRHYVDGRLILKEQRFEQYEYLESIREKGRLVLNLLVLKGDMMTCRHDNKKEEVMNCDNNNDTIDRGKKKSLVEESDEFMNNVDGMTSRSSLLGIPTLFDSSVDTLIQPTSTLVS